MARKKPDNLGDDDALGDDPFFVEIGRRIKELRFGVGITQQELGEAAGGLSGSYIYLVERGRQNMTLAVFRRIAEALGVQMEYLLSDAELVGESQDRSLTRFLYRLEKLERVVKLRREQDDAIVKELQKLSEVKGWISDHLRGRKKEGSSPS